MYDFIIVGGGIVGLSVGLAITRQHPSKKVLILEKEKELAAHQTGHNSGVIHSGIYYKPGSLKARLAKSGNQSMVEFCRKHGINYEVCGKVIVATNRDEQAQLEKLYQRGMENQLNIERLNRRQLQEREPHVNGIEAIKVPSAGIVDYKQVSNQMAELIRMQDGEIRCGETVQSITEQSDQVTVETDKNTFNGRFLINCAGLHSDRIAYLAGYYIDLRIVPFRGEYYKLKPEKRELVNHLIYPVPNPDFPFLGVHFTRMIDGEVEAGPNAVLSFKREGYTFSDFDRRDFGEFMRYKGFWKLARKYMREGLSEMARSLSKEKFVKELQRLIPEIKLEDVVSGGAGVRAQALRSDGTLVDDFEIIHGKQSLHVCNAPSPAATASLEIGREIVRQMTGREIVV
ncbi:L-2-hydroxyglutarate oxidase [Salinibacillus aidingensis]|uniref:L-2-hydroxyglutarate oxidase n=1 Tax=Salinibacillus aidingensis TaxID=237684 RepID=A0ABN1AWB2_9BACI